MSALSECSSDDDCDGRQVCVTTQRCDADVHRVDPEGRTLDAVVVPLPADPRPNGFVIAMAAGLIAVLAGALTWWVRRRRRSRS